ncbi:MAG: HD domain-containing protein [Leptospirales bacterium]|nr:HD domain-containing protein [Leptospirales bacterium]
MGNNDNINEVIEIKQIKAGYRFNLDVYDKDNNLILKAHTPISEGILNHLKSLGIDKLYFDPANIEDIKNKKNEPIHKAILSEELINETYDHTKNVLDEIRETFVKSPADSISHETINKSRTQMDKIISEIDKNENGIFDIVTKLKDMDDYYYQHSTNVAIAASILASRLDFNPDIKSAMSVGGLFHDIGYSSLSKDILNKAQLNDSEFDIIKSHTHIGYKFVEKNNDMKDLEKRIILLHHERADGKGYPYGFDMDHYQNTIPREIRLLGLIDTYITLIRPKPGGKIMTPKEAIRYMLNMVYAPYKTSFAFIPTDIRDFIKALGFIVNKGELFMLPGDLVKINTGEIGIIEKMNRLYPINPVIRIVKNNKMETLKRTISVDLLKSYQNYISNVYDRNPSPKTPSNTKTASAT